MVVRVLEILPSFTRRRIQSRGISGTFYRVRIFWKRLDKLWRKLRNTGSTRRRRGSGRPRSARNVNSVNDLISNQVGQISREKGIRHSSVCRINRQNLKLKRLKKRRAQELTVANCALHRPRARKLLRRFPASAVDFIFFTDELV